MKISETTKVVTRSIYGRGIISRVDFDYCDVIRSGSMSSTKRIMLSGDSRAALPGDNVVLTNMNGTMVAVLAKIFDASIGSGASGDILLPEDMRASFATRNEFEYLRSKIAEGNGLSDIGYIWLYDPMGAVVGIYQAIPTKLYMALGAAHSGYAVRLSTCDITGDFVIPSGVALNGLGRFVSIIRGKITLNPGSSVDQVCVLASGTNQAVGILGPTTGQALINNSIIKATSAGGYAYGVAVQNGNVEVRASHIEGQSQTGVGYGAALTEGVGNLYHYGGCAIGSTAPYLEVE